MRWDFTRVLTDWVLIRPWAVPGPPLLRAAALTAAGDRPDGLALCGHLFWRYRAGVIAPGVAYVGEERSGIFVAQFRAEALHLIPEAALLPVLGWDGRGVLGAVQCHVDERLRFRREGDGTA